MSARPTKGRPAAGDKGGVRTAYEDKQPGAKLDELDRKRREKLARDEAKRKALSALAVPAELLVADEGAINRRLAELAAERHRGQA